MPSALPYSVVPAEFSHIYPLAPRLRLSDQYEIQASHGFKAHQALDFSLSHSTMAWTCLVNSEPQFMWGIAPWGDEKPGSGAPWLLASAGLYRLQRPFLRHCQEYLALMLGSFERLENYVHSGNRTSMRWLRWCGFTLALRPEPYGVAGEPFYHFWRN